MLKSYTIISLSFVLTLSILAPAIISLFNDDCVTVIVEYNEEDSEEKENETSDNEEGEEEKSERLFYTLLHLNNPIVINDNVNAKVFLDRVSSPELEIQLPPPRKLYIVYTVL